MFELNQRVTITGRNGIGPNNAPVFGRTGRICSTHSNAPEGWFSVWLDEPLDGFNVVNIPPQHLEAAQEKKPGLRLV